MQGFNFWLKALCVSVLSGPLPWHCVMGCVDEGRSVAMDYSNAANSQEGGSRFQRVGQDKEMAKLTTASWEEEESEDSYSLQFPRVHPLG